MNPPFEEWTLFTDRRHDATPWPFPGVGFDALTADAVVSMPDAVDDFHRVAPTDGFDTLVPLGLPRERAVCRTRLAVYHDDGFVYVFIAAHRPKPQPELADLLGREDFACMFQLDGIDRGLYFGMNQDGQAVCWARVFDTALQPATEESPWPWDVYRRAPHADLGRYRARVFLTHDQTIGAFAIERGALADAFTHGVARFTASRRCFATNEMVAWAASSVWMPRSQEFGRLRLVDALTPDELPSVRRVDLAFNPLEESGEITVHFRDLWPKERLASLPDRTYAEYRSKCAITLNGEEHVADLAPCVSHAFPLADGWNRLEVQSAFFAPWTHTFQKFSGNRVVARPANRAASPDTIEPPTLEQLRADVRRWHERIEAAYHGGGRWGHPAGPNGIYNISHNGAFTAELYALAYLHIEPRDIYATRLREFCDRALSLQKPGGWFADLAVDPGGEQRFAGGAFDTGSAGEGLMLGHRVLREPRLLDAAVRVMESYKDYRYETNQNYAAFAAWHLTELFEVTGERRALDLAVHYIRDNAARALDPSGAFDGHNYYSGYGAITLKGMAKLLRLLPEDHAYRAALRNQCLRMCNQMMSRQQPDGRFAERNRKYVGFWSLTPTIGLLETARALPGEIAAKLRPAILRAYRARPDAPEAGIVVRLPWLMR